MICCLLTLLILTISTDSSYAQQTINTGPLPSINDFKEANVGSDQIANIKEETEQKQKNTADELKEFEGIKKNFVKVIMYGQFDKNRMHALNFLGSICNAGTTNQEYVTALLYSIKNDRLYLNKALALSYYGLCSTSNDTDKQLYAFAKGAVDHFHNHPLGIKTSVMSLVINVVPDGLFTYMTDKDLYTVANGAVKGLILSKRTGSVIYLEQLNNYCIQKSTLFAGGSKTYNAKSEINKLKIDILNGLASKIKDYGYLKSVPPYLKELALENKTIAKNGSNVPNGKYDATSKATATLLLAKLDCNKWQVYYKNNKSCAISLDPDVQKIVVASLKDIVSKDSWPSDIRVLAYEQLKEYIPEKQVITAYGKSQTLMSGQEYKELIAFAKKQDEISKGVDFLMEFAISWLTMGAFVELYGERVIMIFQKFFNTTKKALPEVLEATANLEKTATEIKKMTDASVLEKFGATKYEQKVLNVMKENKDINSIGNMSKEEFDKAYRSARTLLDQREYDLAMATRNSAKIKDVNLAGDTPEGYSASQSILKNPTKSVEVNTSGLGTKMASPEVQKFINDSEYLSSLNPTQRSVLIDELSTAHAQGVPLNEDLAQAILKAHKAGGEIPETGLIGAQKREKLEEFVRLKEYLVNNGMSPESAKAFITTLADDEVKVLGLFKNLFPSESSKAAARFETLSNDTKLRQIFEKGHSSKYADGYLQDISQTVKNEEELQSVVRQIKAINEHNPNKINQLAGQRSTNTFVDLVKKEYNSNLSVYSKPPNVLKIADEPELVTTKPSLVSEDVNKDIKISKDNIVKNEKNITETGTNPTVDLKPEVSFTKKYGSLLEDGPSEVTMRVNGKSQTMNVTYPKKSGFEGDCPTGIQFNNGAKIKVSLGQTSQIKTFSEDLLKLIENVENDLGGTKFFNALKAETNINKKKKMYEELINVAKKHNRFNIIGVDTKKPEYLKQLVQKSKDLGHDFDPALYNLENGGAVCSELSEFYHLVLAKNGINTSMRELLSSPKNHIVLEVEKSLVVDFNYHTGVYKNLSDYQYQFREFSGVHPEEIRYDILP